jgi:hypothetical protein
MSATAVSAASPMAPTADHAGGRRPNTRRSALAAAR